MDMFQMYMRNKKLKDHRQRLKATKPNFSSYNEEKYLRFRHPRRLASKGTTIDPTWPPVRHLDVSIENERLVERLNRVATRKGQIDDRLKKYTPKAGGHRELEKLAIYRQNQKLLRNLQGVKSVYKIDAYAEKHKKLLQRHNNNRFLKNQVHRTSGSALSQKLQRNFKTLKRNKMDCLQRQQHRNRSPTACTSSTTKLFSKQPSLNIDHHDADGKIYVQLKSKNFSVESKYINTCNAILGKVLSIKLKAEDLKKEYEITLPLVDLKECFRCFPRLLEPENKNDLLSFIIPFLKLDRREQLSVDLGPIVRLSSKIEREAAIAERIESTDVSGTSFRRISSAENAKTAYNNSVTSKVKPSSYLSSQFRKNKSLLDFADTINNKLHN